MEESPEILELHELHYSDLLLLSSPSTSTNASSSSSSSLDEDLLRKMGSVMEALGPMGPGLLAVTGVPNASKLRSQLLPLARKLALLDRETRKRVLKVLPFFFFFSLIDSLLKMVHVDRVLKCSLITYVQVRGKK